MVVVTLSFHGQPSFLSALPPTLLRCGNASRAPQPPWERLYSQTIGQNQPPLPYIACCRYFIVEMRKITNKVSEKKKERKKKQLLMMRKDLRSLRWLFLKILGIGWEKNKMMRLLELSSFVLPRTQLSPSSSPRGFVSDIVPQGLQARISSRL